MQGDDIPNKSRLRIHMCVCFTTAMLIVVCVCFTTAMLIVDGFGDIGDCPNAPPIPPQPNPTPLPSPFSLLPLHGFNSKN